jgi:signal transduction histidine kinase
VVKGIFLKKYEKESLLKNFLVFFLLLETLLVLLFIELYHTQEKEYKQDIYKTMQVCSYTLECKQFNFDFSPKDKVKRHTLYDDKGLYSYFSIPKSEKFYIQITYPHDAYTQDIYKIQQHNLWQFILLTFVLFMLSLFFTFYSLRPIRNALRLNDEFIKDILHDFNTPITSMVLNMRMYNKEHGENPFIKRISVSIDTIVHLQNNLKSFLHNSPSQNTEVHVNNLAKERLHFIKNIYPKLNFSYEESNTIVRITNEELLTRILDNILSNAAKYNKTNGNVKIVINGTKLGVEDTGKGIKNIKKSLQRYHKEQDRGLGLGLHIVQKLTQELNIEMEIKTQEHIGTTFLLDFKHLSKSYE